jgi:psp operon transcriptional activator
MTTELPKLIGQSAALLDAMDRLSAAAPLVRPVLVIGDRGTGKELAAERLHRLSLRWDQAFVQLNCAALPETLLDAELFGYESGAFTGAIKARAGRFEDADGGTLFLDEIATLSAQAQEKLLRVIEYGVVQRIGAARSLQVDVRVVGATNADLPAMVAQGRFRADLLDRLSFEVITLPPLSARREDVPLLVDHFGRRMASELGWPRYPGFARDSSSQLLRHDWPGNVRELKNVVERAVYRWNNEHDAIADVQFDPFDSPHRPRNAATVTPTTTTAVNAPLEDVTDFRGAVAAFELSLLKHALDGAKHNQRLAAKSLKLSYDQLRHALRKHGLL